LSGEFREWLGQFDLVVNYWPDPDGAFARHFPVRNGQQFLTASAMPERAPAAAHYCEVLQRAGLPPSNFFYPLRALNTSEAPTSQRYAPAESPVVRSDALAVHPGSGSRKKNWPAVRWHELILALRDPVRLVCGEAEAEAWNGSALASTVLAERLRRGTLRLAVNQPLEQLIADFAHCRLFIGHDSGVSHLAAACGVPCVLLFGPTDPAVWAPPAPHVRVIRRTDELTSIRVEDVLAALPA
jgi:heptosyltransferase-2